MLIRRTFLPLVACTVWTAALGFAQTTSSTVTRTINFLPVGLAGTETAQVNVVNLASNSSSGTAASCTGTITFLSSTGATLGTAASFTVTSGQTFSAPLLGSGARKVVRAQISLTIPASSAPPCQLASSLETFDTTTGATHAYVGGDGLAFGIGHGRD